MDAGTTLRAARAHAGLTQVALAKRARTSQAAVARYESGAVSPSVATLERLLRAAGAQLHLTTTAAPEANLAGPKASLLRRHRSEVLALARRAGARNVRVFGSVARGDEQPDSDIDLLVDFDVSNGLVPIIELTDQLRSILGASVDVAPVELLKPEVARRALAEAVPL